MINDLSIPFCDKVLSTIWVLVRTPGADSPAYWPGQYIGDLLLN